MKKALKIILAVVALVLALAGGLIGYVAASGIPKYPPEKIDLHVEITPERVARGKRFAELLCVECHMDPHTLALTGKRLTDAPASFGPLFSKNITRDPVHGIGAWTDGELAYLLRTGVERDGSFAPIMVKLGHLSDEDLASIIAFLRSSDPLVAARAVDPPGVSQPSLLTKLLCHVAFKPLEMPRRPIVAPPASDRVATGRYLAIGLECYPCHSADFKTMNEAAPEKSGGYFGGGNQLLDVAGRPIYSANLTADDETGIGKWSEADFVRALKKGFRPDRTVVRYPMLPSPELSDEEAGAIYAYLRTVPKIHHAFARPLPPAPVASGDEGKRLYHQYQCTSCHGEDGVGIADLRHAAEHYPTDAALENWIKNAPAIKPDTKMPAWQGVIPEADYPPLIAYVKKLGVR
ncbi:MAG TPA: c-type cytochrome [Polyangia bacterium]